MKARFTDEQIIAMIKEQESGEKTADVCRRHGISSATFYKYKSKYGGMEPSDAKRLRALGGRERQVEEAVGRTDVGQRHVARHQFKKMVTPVAKRKAVVHLCEAHRCEPAAGV